MKTQFIASMVLTFLFVFLVSVVHAFQVSPLPSDNLIDFDSAWLRGTEFAPKIAGYGNWIDESGHLGLSQGSKNPSPDGSQGTMMQWDSSVRTASPLPPGQDAWAHLIVAAPTPHSTITFSYYSVGRGGADIEVEVWGCDLNGSSCVFLWEPIGDDYPHSRFRPEQSPFLTFDLPGESFETYKIRQHCKYYQGRAGCKTTGYYFNVGD